MWGCPGITDTGLAHLAGIHTLIMRECFWITDAGLAHLTGIHTLDISHGLFARGPKITDAGLVHLVGIHTLDMRGCIGITDAGLTHLAGIHALKMFGCYGSIVEAARARFPPPTEIILAFEII